MDWIAQVEPPSAVVITAAPFGAPAVPTVEPTAQQRKGPTQSTAVSEFTGAGSVTVPSVPTQGDPGAMVDGAAEPVFGLLEEHDAATMATRATRAADIPAAVRDRWGRQVRWIIGREGGALTGGGGAVGGTG
jgi:hypothetical protein